MPQGRLPTGSTNDLYYLANSADPADCFLGNRSTKMATIAYYRAVRTCSQVCSVFNVHIEELQMNNEEPPDTSTIVITVNCPGPYWSSYYDTELEYAWQSPGQSYSDTFHRMLRRHCK
jgi:hypothetical protein